MGSRKHLLTRLLKLLLLFSASNNLLAQKTYPVEGIHDDKHFYYAFTNANIIIDYETSIEKATLLIRDGKIEDIGENISIPSGSIVFDLTGKYIYPSLIDIYTNYGVPQAKKAAYSEGPQISSNTKGAYSWNQAIKSEVNASDIFNADPKKSEEYRDIGFGTALSLNMDGIARGTSVLACLTEEKENTIIIKDKASANYSFDKGSSTQNYPSSLMGTIALLRQTYLDAQWYKHSQNNSEYNISLEAWNKSQELPQIFEVNDKYSVLRADKIGDEYGIQYIIKGNGDEYQRIKEVKATNATLIVPLNFPEAYDVEDPYEAMQVTLAEMKHWELAPTNLSMLEKENITFAITLAGLKDKKDFWKNLRKAIEYGLSEQGALKALTHTPAEILKVSNKIGSLRKGMLANFLITSKKIFEKDNIIYENWVLGKRYKINPLERKDIRGNYQLNIDSLSLKMKVEGNINESSLHITIADSIKAKTDVDYSNDIVSLYFDLKQKNLKGYARLSGYFLQNADDKAKSYNLKGSGQLPNGKWIKWNAVYISALDTIAKKDSIRKDGLVLGSLNFPNKAYGWKEIPKASTVLIKNATVWTNEKEGILKNTDILISEGKILKVGKNIEPEANNIDIIDATGKHVTSGIIDEHSHIAASGGLNEGTQAITSEVRIGDVINPDDINVYRQLSGGVTTSHILHGSANPIGGQTALIKLRWGLSPDKMKFENADDFIKLALGENVKQSNWGDRQISRFPQTRMGVEQIYIYAFTRAKEYEKSWKEYNRLSEKEKQKRILPRKDLELEALLEILQNKRFITCHSYVQSEINMLMHVADSMGFKVNTFTHVLEGYKIADKIKKHQAGASTFSDWWAYKYEVLEAIPQNGAILNKMGITTAFNSDDPEMGRRLNQEAAKAVKYGGITEEEALKFVTLNPAKLLHIDDRVGSIKAGKHADIVLWSDNPLSINAKAEKTFIDGISYFDIQRDRQMQEDIIKERSRLIAKMLEAKTKGERTQRPFTDKEDIYGCETDTH